VEKAYLPSRQEHEVEEFKKLHREKSFDEARTAVQSQIERMFQKAAADEPAVPGMGRYKMHGISHLGPEDVTAAPPPMHHGVRAAIGAHPLAARWREGQAQGTVASRAGSMESIIRGLEEERRGAPRPPAARPLRPPSKPPSAASSLLDLSQPHIRLSPLQRASSHISLTLHDKRGESLLEQARRISVGEAPALPSRTSPAGSRPSPGQLPRNQSQVLPGPHSPCWSRPWATRPAPLGTRLGEAR
jgi:hypothetical protein